MFSEAVLTHPFGYAYARYERTSMKGRNKYDVPKFSIVVFVLSYLFSIRSIVYMFRLHSGYFTSRFK